MKHCQLLHAGRVPVVVLGKFQTGWWVVPSGKNDGVRPPFAHIHTCRQRTHKRADTRASKHRHHASTHDWCTQNACSRKLGSHHFISTRRHCTYQVAVAIRPQKDLDLGPSRPVFGIIVQNNNSKTSWKTTARGGCCCGGKQYLGLPVLVECMIKPPASVVVLSLEDWRQVQRQRWILAAATGVVIVAVIYVALSFRTALGSRSSEPVIGKEEW